MPVEWATGCEVLFANYLCSHLLHLASVFVHSIIFGLVACELVRLMSFVNNGHS